MAINKDDRARQFLPFDALKGFQEALHEKEIIYDTKIELAEDAQEFLQDTLNQLNIGDEIYITYYSQRFYKTISGKLKKIDCIKKKIILENEILIPINTIINLKLL